MAKRFFSTYKSTKNVTYNVEIWDTAFAGTATSFDIAEGGFRLRMSGEGSEILNHISPTDVEFDFFIQNSTDFALITDLNAAPEGQFTIKISKGAVSPEPFWYGQVVADIGSYSEENYPIKFTVRATDGLGLLKTIDFKDTGGAYTGKERALFMIKNAIKKLPYVAIHFGSGDNFISTVMDTWETTMDSGGTDPCALYQTYLDYSVWQKYDKGEEQYTNCHDVIKNILTPLFCRITQRNGVFWIEQIYYRTETTVIVRTYTRDGGLASATNYSTVNDINQTAAGALLATGEYEFFPALRLAEHTYEVNTRRNFLQSVPPMDESSSLINVYKPIDKNGDKTTLRFTGVLGLSISSDNPGPIPTAVLDPFCLIFRVNLSLNTVGLVRDYTLLPNFQVKYDPMEWSVTPGFYVAVPIDNAAFLVNTSSDIFTFTNKIDVMTPVLPESCDDFSISISLEAIEKFDGGTYNLADFTITFELQTPWLEVYSYGSPALTEDERYYSTTNDVGTTNSAVLTTKSIVGTSTDPNSIGAFWVKPASDYILATNWGLGVDTPDRPIEYFTTEIAMSGQYAPTKRLSGTIYGSIDLLARFTWLSQTWLLLGGSWDADNDQITGEWVVLTYDQDFNASPPVKRKYVVTTTTIPTLPPASGQGGPTWEMIQKPPGTLQTVNALTTTDVFMQSGAITSVDISEILTDGDVYAGDTIAIMNPLSGDFDELTVTATSTAGQTAIAVSGTLSVDYPANSLIIKKPKIGTFSLPEGTAGDILYFDGTSNKWIVRNIGTAGQVLTVNAGATAPEWTTGGGGYTDEQAQDAVGGILTDTTEINFTYDDATPAITAIINTNSVVFAKIQQIATARFLGRVTAGTGDIEALTAAQMQTALGYITGNQTITLSGDVTGSGTTAITTTIANNAVTTAKIIDDAVTYAKMQNVSTNNRVLGRVTAGAGNVEELTAANLQTMFNFVDGTMTATRLQFAADANTLDDDANLTWDDTNKRLLIGTGATAAFLNVFSGAITGATEFLRMSGNINGNMIAYLLNANNASTGANAFFGISVGGSGAGDPFMQFIVSGANTWAWGVDNSDSDAMKLSLAATPGSSVATDYIIVGTDGRISLGGTALLALVNVAINGTGGVRLPSGTSAQRPTITNTIIRNNTTFGGLEFKNPFGQWARLTGSNPTGTITPGAGAGTSPTINAVGTDRAFKLNISTGSAPTLNGEILTINFGTAFDILPYISLTPYNAVTATDLNKFYIDFNGNGGFSIKANGTLTAFTTYVLSVVVQQ